MRTAYLLGFITKSTGKMSSVGVFSESTPTCSTALYPFTLLTKAAPDYEAAVANLCADLMTEHSYFRWVIPFLDAQARESLRRCYARRRNK